MYFHTLGIRGAPTCGNTDCPFRCFNKKTASLPSTPTTPATILPPPTLDSAEPVRLRITTDSTLKYITAHVNLRLPLQMKLTYDPLKKIKILTAAVGYEHHM